MMHASDDLVKLRRLMRAAVSLGLVLLIAGIVTFVNELGFVGSAHRVVAQLSFVDMDELQAPVLEFVTRAGEYRGVLAQDSNLFYDYREGMQAEVLYNPAQLQQVKFDHPLVLWAGSAFFLCLVIACFAFVVLLNRFINLVHARQAAAQATANGPLS